MLIENKMGRYLKYAIGEIVLVMIGILLALQVNTWNTNRELKKEELRMLNSLHKEFSVNVNRFDKKFKEHQDKKKSMEIMMSIDARAISTDSLWTLFTIVHNNPTFDPFQGIYNSIINSGKIELISNNILKEKISGFQDLQKDYREDEENVRHFTTENLHKLELSEKVFDNYQFHVHKAKVSKAEESRIKDKYIKFIESNDYESQLVYLNAWLADVLTKEGPFLKEEMVSIINLLEDEIEKNK